MRLTFGIANMNLTRNDLSLLYSQTYVGIIKLLLYTKRTQGRGSESNQANDIHIIPNNSARIPVKILYSIRFRESNEQSKDGSTAKYQAFPTFHSLTPDNIWRQRGRHQHEQTLQSHCNHREISFPATNKWNRHEKHPKIFFMTNEQSGS